MKFIVVDVGNTSTVVGLWTDGRVSHVTHFDGRRPADRAPARNAAWILSRSAGTMDGVAYMSVVPRYDAFWRRLATKELGLKFVAVSYRMFTEQAATPCGLKLDYPRPETIGADRLADAAAAVDRYGAPVIVCDFGTAFTAAAITGDRVWRGGVIAPGFPLMRDYMFERTAKLPQMKLGGAVPKIGRSTEDAMRIGALVGYRGMVREIVTTLAKNLKTDFKLVATGGFAKWVLKDAGMEFTIDQTLTLHGAGLLASGKLRPRARR